ncbi:MAG: YggS family pyridoxal phosphate-dependent enzyme [Bacillota bacterium]|jgi:pyridoxal phosphate enzyme (YggS family)|nr:YggS family pyridoxal phosphate-dependent enzyme [Bacillota bacterium]NLU55337.1 YggS family pyridoxal phosphate-dependent enzyme [Bacillota bacterium]HOA90556.1 YggS family pyridoxal phosphate-dependent enzyme [Bacillota bacterium]HOJ45887.1 YggS family pyridoxal phosphate-dependent enzyme [Bacillota bacterium]HOP54897.1 YggS family pyridoxal phosphate-dependent enzyme [Bacillota bacterium]
MAIKENLLRIRENIEKTCLLCGRDPREVKLLAVSKTFPISSILEAYEAGQRDFGESRVQEFVPKYQQLPDLSWHFIGHIQKNKLNKLLDTEVFIHSVDSLELAEKISEKALERQKVVKVLLQVNIDDDPSKFGFTSEGLLQNIEKILQLKGIAPTGLMTIGALHKDPKETRASFAKLRGLRDALSEVTKHEFPELSMGMSGDYHEAILEGATIVRVGTGVFGQR